MSNLMQTRRRLLNLLRFLAASLCGLAHLAASAVDAPKPLEVKVARPTRGEIIRYVTLPGTIRANQQATLYAKVPGYLKSIAVDKGDKVRAGQALGEIEVPELVAERARYRAELARAQAEVRVAELESARLGKARTQSPDLIVPQAVDAAEGRLAMAQAGIETAKANLERTEMFLSFSRLTAPFSGVVTMRHVDPGAFIPAATGGSPASAAVLTLMDFELVRVQVAVPEIEAALVHEGQPVKLSVDGLPGRMFEARVTRQSYALDDATRTVLVESDLPNPDLALRPGMYATVSVGVEKHTEVLTIPVETLVMERVNAFVFVADNGKAKKTSIRIGFNDGAKLEVVTGLTGSEAVILVGKMALTDGAAVNAMEVR